MSDALTDLARGRYYAGEPRQCIKVQCNACNRWYVLKVDKIPEKLECPLCGCNEMSIERVP